LSLLRVTLLLGAALPVIFVANPVIADEPQRSVFVWNANPDSADPTTEPWENPLNWLEDSTPASAAPTLEDIATIGYGGAFIGDGVDATAYSLATSGGINVAAGGTLTVTAGIVNTAPQNVYFVNAGEIFADIDSAGHLTNSGRIEGKLVVQEGGALYNETSADNGATTATWTGDVENSGSIDNKAAAWHGDVLSNAGNISTYAGGTWDGDVIANSGEIKVDDTGSWTGTVHSNNGNLVLSSAESSWTGDVLDSFGSINSVGNWYGSITSTGWLFLSGYVEGSISLTEADPDRGSLLFLNGDLTVGGGISVDGTLSLLAAEGAQTLEAASLVLSDRSWLEVGIDDQGNADRVELSGAATLAGYLWVGAAEGEGYAEDMRYSILSADSVSGTFGYVGTDLAFLTPMLSTDGSEVFLVLKRNGFSFADGVAGSNDQAAAVAVESLGSGNALYEAALNLTGDEIPGAFAGLAGDIHLATPGTMVAGTAAIGGQIANHLHQSFDALGVGPQPLGYTASGAPAAAAVPVTGPWGAVYALRSDIAASDGLPGSTALSGGLVGGIDTLVDNWRVGIMLEAGSAHSEMIGLDASADSVRYGAGLYAGHEWGDTRLLLGGSISGHAVGTQRTVTLPDLQTLEADYGAATAMAFAELAQRFDFGAVELTPRLGLTHVRYSSDGFAETGGDAALTSTGSVLDSTFATLGIDIGHQFAVGEGTLLTATGTLGWRHGFGDAVSAEHAFGSGAAFAVGANGQAADTLVFGADLALDLDEATTLGLGLTGEHADGASAQALTASWNGRF
jgi:outer membrane autotransporter protein